MIEIHLPAAEGGPGEDRRLRYPQRCRQHLQPTTSAAPVRADEDENGIRRPRRGEGSEQQVESLHLRIEPAERHENALASQTRVDVTSGLVRGGKQRLDIDAVGREDRRVHDPIPSQPLEIAFADRVQKSRALEVGTLAQPAEHHLGQPVPLLRHRSEPAMKGDTVRDGGCQPPCEHDVGRNVDGVQVQDVRTPFPEVPDQTVGHTKP